MFPCPRIVLFSSSQIRIIYHRAQSSACYGQRETLKKPHASRKRVGHYAPSELWSDLCVLNCQGWGVKILRDITAGEPEGN